MQVGEVRDAQEADFEHLRLLCTRHDGWKQAYFKNSVIVWVKSNEVSEFNMIKVTGILDDVPATTVFDVLNDPAYRKYWDATMHEGFDICQLNSNSDIGYYALKTPIPLKKRDFVTQRVWQERDREMMIFNHSVNHTAVPPKKNCVRGISYLTGYYVVSTADNKSLPGCHVTYITQSDPRGKLPAWVINKLSQRLAPKIMVKLQKACRKYTAWKANNSPELKPWLNPEQNDLPQLNPSDIGKWDLTALPPAVDEREAVEATAITADADEDDDSPRVQLKSPLETQAQAAANDGQPVVSVEVPLAAASEPVVPDMAVATSAS